MTTLHAARIRLAVYSVLTLMIVGTGYVWYTNHSAVTPDAAVDTEPGSDTAVPSGTLYFSGTPDNGFNFLPTIFFLSLPDGDTKQIIGEGEELVFSRNYVSTASSSSIPGPPTTTLSAQINPDTTQYQDSIFIAPDDEITLVWNSTNASSCTNNFGAPDSTSGTFDITPGLSPGEGIVYEITCTGGEGGVTSDMIVQTPDIIANTFEINPRVARSGETATFEWELELSDSLTLTADDDLTPYSYECVIRRGSTRLSATPDGVPYIFDAADNDGIGILTTRTLHTMYANLLQCGNTVSEEAEVEVAYGVMEM